MMTNLTESTFKNEVLNAEGIILVDFWAPWCGPCRMVGPVLEQIAREKEGLLKVAKVNVDENPVLASHYGVMSIPTMIVFKNGKLLEKFTGAQPKNVIEKKLERWIN
jgi:thioredoxin 1